MTLNEFWRYVEMQSQQKKVTFDMYRVLVHISLHCHKDKAGNYSTYVSVGRLTEVLGWKSLSRVERQLDKLDAAGLIKNTPVPHNKCGEIDGIVLVNPGTAVAVTATQDVSTAADVEQENRQAEMNATMEESADPWWNDLKDFGWRRAEVELFKQASAHLMPWQAIRQVRSCGLHYGWTAESVAETLRYMKPEVGDPPMPNAEPNSATGSTSHVAGTGAARGFGTPKHGKHAANRPGHCAA